jgi:hypothetical protein
MKKIHGKPIRFARWGGLSSVKQKGYDPSMPTFHSPPCRRGIYAFVWPYIETFILGGYEENQHKWNKGVSLIEIDGELVQEPYGSLKSPRIFDYEGEIWHHFGEHLHQGRILDRKGSWCKTSFDDFVKAIKKELHIRKSKSFNSFHGCFYIKGTNNPTFGWVKDDLEVFIEKI